MKIIENNSTILSDSGHGGNIHKLSRTAGNESDIIDFSANINPLGPPSWLRNVISRELSGIVHYPDPDCFSLTRAIADKHGLSPSQIIAANGTTEILHLLPRIIPCNRAVIPVPSYIDYIRVMELNNIQVEKLHLSPADNFRLDCEGLHRKLRHGDLVIVGSPNNPSASIISGPDFIELAHKNPSVWFIVDEAFLDFIEGVQSLAGVADNIITLNSLTKFYAIPGLRLGYSVLPDFLAEKAKEIVPPWSVNSLAQKVGERLFSDEAYHRHTLRNIKKLNTNFHSKLSSFSELKVFPSKVNFFLIHLRRDYSTSSLSSFLLQSNISIRLCHNYAGLDESYFRIAVRTEEENDLLVDQLHTFFQHSPNTRSRQKKKIGSLMIQGTSSNAGKSVIVAALCRILIQDGIRVAPFKAQNMSLNSFVTHDGYEMGRAQVVQAQAAKLDPDIRMNPVLLKPNSDIGSQVIIQGKSVGNMNVSEYVQYKAIAGQKACESYDSLASDYDAIILEGAGSPGEVNLKSHDIVNMQMARYANSPVILVGDIDRGGVYASFVGTLEVLEEWERRLVSGFLVNRFRGDASLLGPAHQYIYDRCGLPVVGTVPYINDLGIPEEDSVSFKEGKLQKEKPTTEHVEIAVINLPHISNFTDIEPFLEEPDVYLNIVDSPEELYAADAVILPGSKNVMGDLDYIHKSQMGKRICALAEKGVEIVGICGGYQILGSEISDPFSIESDGARKKGLSLLNISTHLASEKTLIRKSGSHRASEKPVFGYEIHHGLSEGENDSLFFYDDGTHCGTSHDDLNVWGAYLHGIFDSDLFRRWFIDNLRQKKGLQPLNTIVSPYNLEQSFDFLAKKVRESTDMDLIYKLLDL